MGNLLCKLFRQQRTDGDSDSDAVPFPVQCVDDYIAADLKLSIECTEQP